VSKPVNRISITRREALLLSTTVGLGAALSKPAFGSNSVKTGAHQEPGNVSTPRSAIAKTQYGKVRGFVDGGVLTFKGVPYGATAAEQNRWLPAKPPAPWTDEYPALVYGANCPQNLHTWTGIEQTFLFDWDDGWQSEDMLKLNIWTPSLMGKRPVMFYMHGGGFSFGSSYELPSHEGAQMARHHDVVQVSVNHRLNILGFFDVAEIGGSAYEDSVNASNGRRVVCKPFEDVWRGEGDGHCCGAEEVVSGEEDSNSLVYMRRQSGAERAFDAEQRGEDGAIETRTQGRAGIRLLLHLADPNP
jgi:para-nitrobenzyl esterase